MVAPGVKFSIVVEQNRKITFQSTVLTFVSSVTSQKRKIISWKHLLRSVLAHTLFTYKRLRKRRKCYICHC